jgi:uncharacterized delta-60 repeat protein
MTPLKQGLLCLFSFVCSILNTSAQSFDSSFKPQITGSPYFSATAIQADGKILVAGEIVAVGTTPVTKLVRLNADGTLDASFKITLSSDSYVHSILPTADGKIILAGRINGSMVTRLNSDGSKDPNFFEMPAVNFWESAYKAVAAPDGKIYVMRPLFGNSPLIRLNSNGTQDLTFNAGTGPNGYGPMTALLPLADGKLLVIDNFDQFNDVPAKKAVRLNSNGSIDNTFNVGSGFGTQSYIRSAFLLSDERIVIIGSFTSFNNTPVRNIVTLLPSGQLDPNFVVPGPSANFFEYEISAAMPFDNGILLCGTRYNPSMQVSSYAVMKIRNDGTQDVQFPPIHTTPMVGAYSMPILIPTSASEFLFLGAHAGVGNIRRQSIARFKKDASIDIQFQAKVYGPATIKCIREQSDGKILVGGSFSQVGDTPVSNFVRLNNDGTIDQNFLANITPGAQGEVNCIEVLADGKIALGGYFNQFNNQARSLFAVLNSDGSLNGSFSAMNFYYGGVNVIRATPSGKLIVGGSFSYVNNDLINGIAVLTASGTLDQSFSKTLIKQYQSVNAVDLQSDGNLIIGGQAYMDQKGLLFKTDPSGAIIKDLSSNFQNQSVNAIEILPGDTFVAGGFLMNGSSNTPNPVHQYDKNGNLIDNLSVAAYNGSVTEIVHYQDDKIALAGNFNMVNNVQVRTPVAISLKGSMQNVFNHQMNGYVLNFTKARPDKNIFYAGGNFSSVNGEPFFSIAKFDLETPLAPKDLQRTIDDTEGKVSLSWSDQSSLEDGFIIERATNQDAFTEIATVGVNIIQYTDLSVEALKTYRYRVRAFRASSKSSASNEVTASTETFVPPAPPKNLTVSISGTNETTLSWDDASSNETGFVVERSRLNGEFLQLKVTALNTTTYSDSPITIGERYSYRVRASNKFGHSPYSNVADVLITSTESPTTKSLIYPNPAHDIAYYSSSSAGSVTIDIITSLGETVARQQINQHGTSEIDISGLSPGNYIVTIKAGKDTFREKLIKK